MAYRGQQPQGHGRHPPRGGHSSGKGELSAEREKAQLGNAHAHEQTCRRAHAHTHMPVRTHTPTCMRTCVQMYVRAHTNTICVCAHVYRRMHTGACACTHAHAMHAVHTHAHVCTHTNVHADRCVWRSGFTCACCREAKRSQLTMEAARPRWACHVAATQACRLSAGAWWISCSLASMAGRLLVKKLSVQRSSGSACGGATALTHLVGTDSPGGNRLSETA